MKCIILSTLSLLLAINVQAQISQQQKTANLETFAKAYGYVRYFHPSDEAAQVKWEDFLYYGSKEVENAANSKILKEKLTQLFNPIAPAVIIIGTSQTAKASDEVLKRIQPADVIFNRQITWQHYGFGTGPGLYRSIRTNRPTLIPDMKTTGFGNATNFVDAKPYRGKKIRLTAQMKTAVSSGQGQMWLRVDRENKVMGFFDNMDARPVKKSNWATYQTIGKVDDDATGIVYGTFLRGLGKMWVDGFVLEVEENGKWIKIPINNPSFEESTGKSAKGWNIGSPGYRYDIVEEGAPDGKNVLLISDNSEVKTEAQLFDTKAKFNEYVTASIGKDLSIVLPLVLMGSENATYPIANAKQYKTLQEKIQAAQPENKTDADVYVRLSGVMITWNIFQHFYPYQKDVNTDWAAQLPANLTAAYDANTTKDYTRLLSHLTEKLQDGHVSISGPLAQGYYNTPVTPKFVEGKIVIAHIDSAYQASNSDAFKAGDVVNAIDGKPALQLLEQAKSEVSGSPQWKMVRALSTIFNGANQSEVLLTIKRGNEPEKEIRVKRAFYRNPNDLVTIKKLENDIYYLNIGTTEMKDIKARLPELVAAKGIICDLRGYPRNNNELINYLMKTEDNNKWMFVPQINYPNYEKVAYEGMGWNLKPSTPHISAKIIFLTAGGAISYAESYMGFIKQYKLATIVGQPTAGANGNVTSFTLPGNYTIRFTGMRVTQQDGTKLQAIGIQPDVFVQETLKGVAAGRDEYMDKALEILNATPLH